MNSTPHGQSVSSALITHATEDESTDPACYGAFNAAYMRYFPDEAPARIFLCVPCFFGPFDVEVDCIAVV